MSGVTSPQEDAILSSFEGQLQQVAEVKAVQQVDPSRPLDQYLTAGERLLAQIRNLEGSAMWRERYIALWRFLAFVNNVVMRHPSISLPQHRARKAQLVETCHRCFDELEVVQQGMRDHIHALSLEDPPLQLSEETTELPEEDRELGRLGEEMGMHCGETDARPLNGTGGGGDPAAKSAKSPMEYFASMGLIAGPQQLPIALGTSGSSSKDQELRTLSSAMQYSSRSALTPYLSSSGDSSHSGFQARRQVVLNEGMLKGFLRHAHANTERSLETCGILMGKESPNGQQLVVTHCVIPPQHGDSDSCEATDEDEVYALQLEKELNTLGWIHTHPTQDAFLSSVDLHTHYGYQRMLPEAIAVVMAPRATPSCGIFQCTEEAMEILAHCQKRGFHEHQSTGGHPLFRSLGPPDLLLLSAAEASTTPCELLDLRPPSRE